MPTIKCSVTECHYNENVMCHAPMIQVAKDGTVARKSQETKCDTFKPR